jgi:hypothetical protein
MGRNRSSSPGIVITGKFSVRQTNPLQTEGIMEIGPASSQQGLLGYIIITFTIL